MSTPRGMILAAGLGTRMRPLTETRPKALVEVLGRPLIDFGLRTLAAAGLSEVIVNQHHLGDQVRAYVGNGSRWGLRVEYSPEDPLQGSGGAIRQARPLLGDTTIVALNADTLAGVELGPLIDEHRRRGAAATMVLRRDPEVGRYGAIHIRADGRIQKFLEHAAAEQMAPTEAYMFTGVQILEPLVFDFMIDGPFSITEVTYPRMLAAAVPLFGTVFEGPWLTVGTPEERVHAEGELRRRALDWPRWMELC